MNEFAKWLRKELETRGYTQGELARRSGMTAAQVSRVLNDSRSPGVDFCNGIARALRVPPEEVFRRAGHLGGRSDLSVIEAITILNRLDDARLNEALSYLRRLPGKRGHRPKTETS